MRAFLFLVIFSSLISCSSNGGDDSAVISKNADDTPLENFDLVIEANLGEDHGQGLGTLFSARDSAGHVILAAGFQDSYSTKIRDNTRMLVFYCKGQNESIQIEAIGKPFGSEVNGARLIADNGVFAFYYNTPVRIDRNYGIAAEWMPTNFFDVQYIGAKRLMMLNVPLNESILLYESILLLDDEIVYSPGENFLFYYSNGIIAIFHENPDRVYIGQHDFTEDPKIDLSKLMEFSIDGFPYIFGTYRDELIIGTNTGAIYSFCNDIQRVIRENNGTSFQLYSAINVNGRLMLGHYPSGSIYVYDEDGLHEFEHPIPVPLDANENQREAQTLCLFSGDLYAGIWPWGELWRYNFDLKEWYFVDRLYSIPDMSPEIYSPYQNEMDGIGEVYNYWGQRITSMVPYEDSLYIATMNKAARPYVSGLHSFISEESIEQYGQIYRLSGPIQIAAPISWRNFTTFRFKISAGKVSMFQDGEILEELESDVLRYGCRKIETINVGDGVFGIFGGVEITKLERLR